MVVAQDVARLGFIQDRLDLIRPNIARYINADKLAGAVTLVARRGELAHLEAVGFSDRESATPMQTDSIFRIYSMTKPITCVAAMQLHEKGLFRLNEPIANYLPAFRNVQVYAGGAADDLQLEPVAQPVTIRSLFTHTSGLTYHFTEYGPIEALYRQHKIVKAGSLEALVDQLLELPLAFQPGARFRYSLGHDVLARLVEIISGQPFDSYLRQHILDPLGMSDTDFFVPAEKHSRFTSMYGAVNIDEPDTSLTSWYGGVMAGINRKLSDAQDSYQNQPHNELRGGAGLVSTALDYWRFAQMMLNNGELNGVRIIGRKTIELMRTNQLTPSQIPWEIGGQITPGYGFGLGMSVLTDLGQAGHTGSVGAYGWGGAANTSFWIDPAEELIGIILSQFQPSGFHPSSADFQTAVYQALA